MLHTTIEYFEYLISVNMFVNVNLLHTNRVCSGYIRVVNKDGIFVSAQMGDDQRIDMGEMIYIPYAAISCVERGL